MKDPDGDTTTYMYDAANHLVKVTDALGESTTYGYDADGNRTSRTDAEGVTTTYTYDASNRLTAIQLFRRDAVSVAYTYDNDNSRISMTDGSGLTTYSYNSRDLLLTVAHGTHTYSYTYDPDGNVTSVTYPDDTTTAYSYNKDERVATLSAGAVSATLAYNVDGELTSVVLPSANGYTESIAYDPAGRVASVADSDAASTLTTYAYTYDKDGNPTTIMANGETDTYTYDARNRLTKVCYGISCANGSISYAYDANGNRISENEFVGCNQLYV